MTIKQILLLTLLSASPLLLFATDYYIATVDLNVRNGAGAKYSVSFNLQKGDKVEVISKKSNWYKIKYLGQSGYANAKYLTPISDSELNTFQEKRRDNSSFGVSIILIILGVIVFLWLLPILIIVSSSKTTFGEKIAWVLAVLFISWFAWIFYMLLAPIKKKE